MGIVQQMTPNAVFDAAAHGVKADGSTDNAAPLVSLLTLVNAAGGGVILLPAGVINFIRPFDFTNHNKVVFRGAGYQVSTLNYVGPSTADTALFFLGGASDNTFEGFSLTLPADFAGWAFSLDWSKPTAPGDPQRNVFRDLDINCPQDNIKYKGGFRINHSVGTTIERTRVVGGVNAVVMSDVAYSINAVVRDGCVFSGQADYSVVLNGGCESIVIDRNVFEPCADGHGRGITHGDASYTFNLSVTNNWFGDTVVPTNTSWVKARALGLVVTNNRMTIGPGGTGIRLSGCQAATITGNHIDNGGTFLAFADPCYLINASGNDPQVPVWYENPGFNGGGTLESGGGPCVWNGSISTCGNGGSFDPKGDLYLGHLAALPGNARSGGITYDTVTPELSVFPRGDIDNGTVALYGSDGASKTLVEGARVGPGWVAAGRHVSRQTSAFTVPVVKTAHGWYVAEDIIILDDGGSLTLPASQDVTPGRSVTLTAKNAGTKSATVSAAHGDGIEGSPTLTLPSNGSATLTLIGGETGWVVVSRFGDDPTDSPWALVGSGADGAHISHGHFWPDGEVNVGKFFHEMWVKIDKETYLLSDGYGGGHADLFGVNGIPCPLSGNVFDGVKINSFSGTYQISPGERVHVAVSWDGQFIRTHINGVVDSRIPFAGPRMTRPYSQGNGILYILGSSHLNAAATVYAYRLFDRDKNPLYGKGDAAFAPSRFFSTGEGDMLADLIVDTSTKTLHDLSAAGVSNTLDPNARVFHHGYLSASGGDTTGVQDTPTFQAQPIRESELPRFVRDAQSPYGRTFSQSGPGGEAVLPPLPVPAGALVWDDFRRPNQTDAFQAVPTLGLTVGGSLGPQAWECGVLKDAVPSRPSAWGILGGSAVCLEIQPSVALVDSKTNAHDVQVRRGVSPHDNLQTTAAFRATDLNNFYSAGISYPTVGGPVSLYICKTVDGVTSLLPGGSFTVTDQNSLPVLRVRIDAAGLATFFLGDGENWTQVGELKGLTELVGTKVGLSGVIAPYGYAGSLSRFFSFAAFAA